MPIPDADCDTCSATCTSLYELAGSVLAVAYEAVACQLDPALCDGFHGFVSHAEPNILDGDYVATWVSSLGVRDRNQNTSAGLMLPIATAEIAIKLMESGFPTMTGEGSPSFESLTRAAMHSYSHAEAMFRKVVANIGAGGPNRILRDCGFSGVSALVPARPSGGLVGWQFTVTVRPTW
jgi:hypothetical protein